MYHATDSRNYQAILQNGLLTQAGGNNLYGSSYGNEEVQEGCQDKIYLSPFSEHVKFYAKLIVDGFAVVPSDESGNFAVVFEVRVDSDLLNKDPEDSQAYYISRNIPAKDIKPIQIISKKNSQYLILNSK